MERKRGQRRRSRRPAAARLLRRWLAVAVLALVAFLYYQPLQTYRETRSAMLERAAEVASLEAEKRRLERRLAVQTSEQALRQEARRLGYVEPGERLFVVKGIVDWRKARAAERRATIGGDG